MIGTTLLVLSAAVAIVQGDGIRLEFDQQMHSRVVEVGQSGEQVLGPFSDSETLKTPGGEAKPFAFTDRKQSKVNDSLGEGTRVSVIGRAGAISKQVDVTAYSRWPRWL